MKYDKAFREEAIKLSDEIGVKKAAKQLGLPYYTLSDWRKKYKHNPRTPETEAENESVSLKRKMQS